MDLPYGIYTVRIADIHTPVNENQRELHLREHVKKTYTLSGRGRYCTPLLFYASFFLNV